MSSKIVTFLVLLLVVLNSCYQIEASSSIESGSPVKESESEVRRLKRPLNRFQNPIERPILDFLEKANTVDATRYHVRYLLNEQDSYDFGTKLSAVDILHRSGFGYQLFNVTSKDGYTTQIVRLINPLVPPTLRKTPPVVLYGGQGSSSAAFLMASLGTHMPVQWPANPDWPDQANGVNRSLAITLTNNGYDVWLIGARGSDKENRRRTSSDVAEEGKNSSQKHKAGFLDGLKLDEKLMRFLESLNPFATNQYWSFSHDDIIKHELRVQIDRVLLESGQSKISLVTYSNGGFIAYALASVYPEYASRTIDTMISLAPAVFTNKFNLVLGTTGILDSLTGPNSTILNENLDSLARGVWFNQCKSKVLRYTACKTALDMLYGFSDAYQTHIELNLIDYTGRPVSAAGFKQTLQCSYSDRFQYYDYGFIGNLIKYNSLLPPVYELSSVKLPRAFVVTGQRDAIVDSWSIKKLLSSTKAKHIEIPGYNHLDLLAGFDVDDKVNGLVLRILDERHSELSYEREGNRHISNEQEHPTSTISSTFYRPSTSTQQSLTSDSSSSTSASSIAGDHENGSHRSSNEEHTNQNGQERHQDDNNSMRFDNLQQGPTEQSNPSAGGQGDESSRGETSGFNQEEDKQLAAARALKPDPMSFSRARQASLTPLRISNSLPAASRSGILSNKFEVDTS